jgi:hypothetical protein
VACGAVPASFLARRKRNQPMDERFILMGIVWWVFGAIGTFVLGTQVGGRPLMWGIVGVLLGPLGMFGALIVPAFEGRVPKTTRSRVLAFVFTLGQLIWAELMLRSVGFGSIVERSLWR